MSQNNQNIEDFRIGLNIVRFLICLCLSIEFVLQHSMDPRFPLINKLFVDWMGFQGIFLLLVAAILVGLGAFQISISDRIKISWMEKIPPFVPFASFAISPIFAPFLGTTFEKIGMNFLSVLNNLALIVYFLSIAWLLFKATVDKRSSR